MDLAFHNDKWIIINYRGIIINDPSSLPPVWIYLCSSG